MISAPAFDVSQVRADFPILAQPVNDQRLTYLDNAASTQVPQAVIDRLVRYHTVEHANVHRGVHTLSQRATDVYDEARCTVQRFIHAASVNEIIFTRGTTDGINTVAGAFGRDVLKPGDEVLITELEHHANLIPWQMACERSGAKLVVAPIMDTGELDFPAFEALLGSGRVRIVAAAHVSNALGSILPVAAIAEKAHAAGAAVLLDGAQAMLNTPVDVQALGCDFYVFSGHKLCAPTGIGVLYGKAAWLERLGPWQGGGSMIRTVTFEKTTYAKAPAKFEAGTPPIAGAVGLAAAIDYLMALGIARIAAHEHELLEAATKALSEIPGVRIIGTARDKAAVLSFTVRGVHPHDVGTVLDQAGVAIRAGHHCAQPLMARLGVPATARASFAFYNTHEDVSALATAVCQVNEIFN